MGLFKKKEENIAVEDTDVTATVDAGRRFSVIIEGITTMLDGNGSIITGQLFGKILKGDKVYVYMAAKKPIECEVQAIEATVDGKGSIVNASRSLMCAWMKREDLDAKDFAQATRDEAIDMRDKLNNALKDRKYV